MSEFRREHHRRIAQALRAFDAELLFGANCLFGGGTAIALLLGEYRESVDINLLCSDRDGYRQMRQSLNGESVDGWFTVPVKQLRPVRKDRDKLSTFLEIDGAPIKLECVLEARIGLDASDRVRTLEGVPVLSISDLYAEKLLANADRGLDTSIRSRDLVDLAMLAATHGEIPESAWTKASAAYGEKSIQRALAGSLQLFSRPDYRRDCLMSLRLEKACMDRLDTGLRLIADALPAEFRP